MMSIRNPLILFYSDISIELPLKGWATPVPPFIHRLNKRALREMDADKKDDPEKATGFSSFMKLRKRQRVVADPKSSGADADKKDEDGEPVQVKIRDVTFNGERIMTLVWHSNMSTRRSGGAHQVAGEGTRKLAEPDGLRVDRFGRCGFRGRR